MIKNKFFIGTVIPTIVALGVVGSGFSVWYFGEQDIVEASRDISIKIEDAAEIGSISFTGDSTLVLDSTTNGEGVYFKGAGEKTSLGYADQLNVMYNVKEGSTPVIEGVSDIKFTTTFSVSDKLDTYIDFDFTNWSYYLGGANIEKSGLDYKVSYLYSDVYGSSTDNGYLLNLGFVKPSYKNEPKNLEEYNQMKEDLKDAKITLNFKAEVVKE